MLIFLFNKDKRIRQTISLMLVPYILPQLMVSLGSKRRLSKIEIQESFIQHFEVSIVHKCLIMHPKF